MVSDHPIEQRQLAETISALMIDPGTEQVGAELSALQSIYGEDSVLLWAPPLSGANRDTASIRFEVVTT